MCSGPIFASFLAFVAWEASERDAPVRETRREVVFVVSPREDLAVVVHAHATAAPRIRGAQLLDLLNAALRPHTDLAGALVSDRDVARCMEDDHAEGRLTCFAAIGSPTRTPTDSRDGRSQAAADTSRSDLMIVFSLGNEAGGIVRTWIVDEAKARTLRDAARDRGLFDTDDYADLEDEIVRTAILDGPRALALSDDGENPFMEMLALGRPLRRILEDRGHWDARGEVRIESNRGDVAIRLDGANVGATVVGTTRLVGVHPGRRHLALSHEDLEPYEIDVDVVRSSSVTLAPVFTERQNVAARASRRATFWTGVAASAAGVALSVLALTAESEVRRLCIQGSGSNACDDTRSFLRTGSPPNASSPSGSGVPIAPLGYSLIGAGVAFTLGATFIGDSDDLPWLSWVTGAVVFGASMALSASLDGHAPSERP